LQIVGLEGFLNALICPGILKCRNSI